MEIEVFDEPVKEIIYTVKSGETRNIIAKKFEVETENIEDCGVKDLTAGDKVIVNLTKKVYHIVKPCETAEKISAMYNVPQEEIIKNNGAARLFVGQRVFIKQEN